MFIYSSFKADLTVKMIVVKGWSSLWLKNYFMLVVNSFKNLGLSHSVVTKVVGNAVCNILSFKV